MTRADDARVAAVEELEDEDAIGEELPDESDEGDEEDATAELVDEAAPDEALPRTVLHQDLETRVETFDDEGLALRSLEPHPEGHRIDEFLCTRCRLWRHTTQLADPKEVTCRDCAAI